MLVPCGADYVRYRPGAGLLRVAALPGYPGGPREDTRNARSAVFLSTVLAALTLPLWMLSLL